MPSPASSIARRAARRLALALDPSGQDATTLSTFSRELERLERMHQQDLAQRLHDGPLQDVIAALQDVVDLRAGEEIELADVEEALRAAVAGMRRAGADLYDDVVSDAGLAAALGRIAHVVERNGGPSIEVHVAADTSTEHDELLVSATRELLQNVRKHAQATHARVLVDRDPAGRLRLQVQDDGIGLDDATRRAAADAGHLGLRSIEDRAHRFGGTLRLEPASSGTSVTVLLPANGDRRWHQVPVTVERRGGLARSS